jgi:alpha-ribazole phosphatase
MRLYLVRHPRPEVAEHICYGCTNLPPRIDEMALLQAKLLAFLPKNIPLFSSPLKRCADLAEMLASALGCGAPIYDARLAEMDFGDWEMRAWDDIPRSEIDAWADDLVEYRPGNGENLLQVVQRVHGFREQMSKLNAEQIVVICHAGTIRLLLAGERGLSLADTALYAAQNEHKIAYGEVVVLDCQSAL